ncbi:MAG: hypothetical protein Q7S96_04065 [bacterium]|nr:hypothetical protein [bacterium]
MHEALEKIAIVVNAIQVQIGLCSSKEKANLQTVARKYQNVSNRENWDHYGDVLIDFEAGLGVALETETLLAKGLTRIEINSILWRLKDEGVIIEFSSYDNNTPVDVDLAYLIRTVGPVIYLIPDIEKLDRYSNSVKRGDNKEAAQQPTQTRHQTAAPTIQIFNSNEASVTTRIKPTETRIPMGAKGRSARNPSDRAFFIYGGRSSDPESDKSVLTLPNMSQPIRFEPGIRSDLINFFYKDAQRNWFGYSTISQQLHSKRTNKKYTEEIRKAIKGINQRVAKTSGGKYSEIIEDQPLGGNVRSEKQYRWKF